MEKDKTDWEIVAEWEMPHDIIYSPASFQGTDYVCEENRTTRISRLYKLPATPNITV